MAGNKVGPEFAVYAASKFAVRVLAEGLLQEVKPYNIRTTVISPGAVATDNILRHCGSAPANADRIQARVRGLAISRSASTRRARDAGCFGIGGSRTCA